jgi:hypothetical protein
MNDILNTFIGIPISNRNLTFMLHVSTYQDVVTLEILNRFPQTITQRRMAALLVYNQTNQIQHKILLS